MDIQKVVIAFNTVINGARKACLTADEHDSIKNAIITVAQEAGLPMNNPVVEISPPKEASPAKEK